MKRLNTLFLILTFLVIGKSSFAKNVSDKEEDTWLYAAAEMTNNTIFGQIIDESTIAIGCEFEHNEERNRFTYYYIVEPNAYEISNTAIMKEILRNGTKENLINILNGSDKENANFMYYLLSKLIENDSELVYSYCGKTKCFSIIFDAEDLKEIFVSN